MANIHSFGVSGGQNSMSMQGLQNDYYFKIIILILNYRKSFVPKKIWTHWLAKNRYTTKQCFNGKGCFFSNYNV